MYSALLWVLVLSQRPGNVVINGRETNCERLLAPSVAFSEYLKFALETIVFFVLTEQVFAFCFRLLYIMRSI
jgi:hypothetical protein